MSKLKVSELFYSIQGEGLHVGTPSIFLRTFGCNFTCGGFGMPRGEISTERDKVDASAIRDYKSLPLVSTGCDSYASWDPRFKHLSKFYTVEELVQSIASLLPNGEFGQDSHLVITGGEPLLGWQKVFPELLSALSSELGLEEVTFETNGTQRLLEELTDFMSTGPIIDYTFSVSPKLSVSGESWKNAIKPRVVALYGVYGYTYLKFVVGTDEDVEEVDRAVDEYTKAGFFGPVYLMPVGGTASDSFFKTEKEVALLAMKKGYRFSPRLQVNLFKNEWGT